ncbi:tyrosine-type recombinase/integrase [Priestia aryabhattai]|uniref:tyrosine-type recombinase/integrase n=1 Tax=Priestia aryabhattai TaxID=412384 RepID=UPI003CB06EBB
MTYTPKPYVEAFVTDLTTNQNKTASTVKMYKYDIESFISWYENQNSDLPFSEWLKLNEEDFLQYFGYLTTENSSQANLKRIASSLNSMLRFYEQDIYLVPTKKSQRPLEDIDFLTDVEIKRLLNPKKYCNLSSLQSEMYEYLGERNLSILLLMIKHGLTVNDIYNLSIEDVNFTQSEIRVYSKDNYRLIKLRKKEKQILLSYYESIPDLFRPALYSSHPLFLPFNPQSLTFYYDYDKAEPKRLSIRGIQKVIMTECKRANLKRIVSSTQLRNTAILLAIKAGLKNKDLQYMFGMKTPHALLRYKRHLKEQPN